MNWWCKLLFDFCQLVLFWLSGKPARLIFKPLWKTCLIDCAFKTFLANTIEFYWHEPLPSSTYVTLWYFHIWETAQYLTQGLDKESQLALLKLSDKSAGLCFLHFSGISLCTFSTVNFWAIAEYIFGKPARLCFLTFQQSILLFLIVNSVLIFHFSTNTEYKFGKPARLCFWTCQQTRPSFPDTSLCLFSTFQYICFDHFIFEE